VVTLMTIPSSLATTMYYNIVYEGAAKNLTLKHSGDLGVATKEPRKGRPAAIGRELLRLVISSILLN